MNSKKQLTAAEFEWIRPHLERQGFENIEHIRRVMVDKVLQKNIAAELNMSEQGVSMTVGRAWKVHLEHGQRPEGWRPVNVTLPNNMADVVEQMAHIARTGVRG
jgi:hypothetical protein